MGGLWTAEDQAVATFGESKPVTTTRGAKVQRKMDVEGDVAAMRREKQKSVRCPQDQDGSEIWKGTDVLVA